MALTTRSDYRTSDMALVSYLKFLGHEPQDVVWENGTCYWIFVQSDGLISSVDTYASGQATIEPKEYNRLFGKTKREFFDNNPDEHNRR